MKQIVECVANISEGQNKVVIDAIAKSITNEPNTILLHIDSGFDANRTVYTFAGSLSSLKNSVLNMYATALKHIDMTVQKGTHPRIGAIDVCPFIPISGILMADLIPWVDDLAQEIADRFSIAVYLYEESAKHTSRQNLATIRQGEYENLSRKFNDPLWIPDYGPRKGWEKSGATVIGARPFLLAYNINLASQDLKIAKSIAKKIRGSGYISNSGKRIPGLFASVKSIGWIVKEYSCAQVSTNLTNYSHCSFHQVYEACQKIALTYGTHVNGSELIGLTPKNALLVSGRFYGNVDMTEAELVKTACEYLGLSTFSNFDPQSRVIEYLLKTHLSK